MHLCKTAGTAWGPRVRKGWQRSATERATARWQRRRLGADAEREGGTGAPGQRGWWGEAQGWRVEGLAWAAGACVGPCTRVRAHAGGGVVRTRAACRGVPACRRGSREPPSAAAELQGEARLRAAGGVQGAGAGWVGGREGARSLSPNSCLFSPASPCSSARTLPVLVSSHGPGHAQEDPRPGRPLEHGGLLPGEPPGDATTSCG